ncbi:FAD/NAD(P)-binding protein [Glarea lozoyensis ATCC 20868]|uniref:FAD/NAD(P)-binding protein n=1 Tax=Glarea lozoyensis (strain ATCC 20868 / MF5171) TaxID=1116229 RepID=S3D2J7_GLAL2|nr:FAD/NAD(P)-binding protein [Glarea lozoyensis ATCC 20868]EPE26256.1 FAD/NAD(P)-binding protein [Glarea lozoyensis ATCC 20868]
MAPPQSISIIGAGIGGLTLARCLLKRNIPIVLYENMPSGTRHSYAITLLQSSYQPLLDVPEIDESAFKRRVAVDGTMGGNGAINAKLLVQQSASSSNSFRAHRGKLEELLREGLDVRWEHTLERVETIDSHVVLYFQNGQNGQKVQSDCVIGLDGIHSNTRK